MCGEKAHSRLKTYQCTKYIANRTHEYMFNMQHKTPTHARFGRRFYGIKIVSEFYLKSPQYMDWKVSQTDCVLSRTISMLVYNTSKENYADIVRITIHPYRKLVSTSTEYWWKSNNRVLSGIKPSGFNFVITIKTVVFQSGVSLINMRYIT